MCLDVIKEDEGCQRDVDEPTVELIERPIEEFLTAP